MQRRLPRPAAVGVFIIAAAGAAQVVAQTQLPEAPAPVTAPATRTLLPAATGIKPSRPMAMVNGRPYVKPTSREQFNYYVRDTYWWPGMARSMARALYGQGIGKPEEWGQDWPGFGQRVGTSLATTAINGNVRYAMEMVLKEDMRYIPCHGCSAKKKIWNAFLAEFTARHASDGHRFFTLTPIVSDFSGPIIANSYWVPGHGPLDGLVATRTVAVTRVGGHLLTEFLLERRHKDPPYEDPHKKPVPATQPGGPVLQPRAPAPQPQGPAGTSTSLN
jgi:hypothetical protein